MKLSDQAVKFRLVLLAAAFALVGFVLELGPVGGVFSLMNKHERIIDALSIELSAFGYLAYLALAASAFVGLHPTEVEPTPKEPPPGEPSLKAAGKGEVAGEQIRVRPELHQMRMIFIALGGYALLKGISLNLMAQNGVDITMRLQLFKFGFVYVALAWFVMWQFLRWFAQRRRWVRLQAELVGADITRVVAIIILLAPAFFAIELAYGTVKTQTTLLLPTLLLYLVVVAASLLLWRARPLTLRRTVIGLLVCGAVIVLLTCVLGVLEAERYTREAGVPLIQRSTVNPMVTGMDNAVTASVASSSPQRASSARIRS